MHRNAIAVTEAAHAVGLSIQVREFPEGTKTAADAAAAIGVAVGQIVKSLIFACGDPALRDEVRGGGQAGGREGRETGEVVVALVSGDNLLAEKKLASAAGEKGAWRVDAETVRAATGFPVGGVPPFGHNTELRTFLDVDLLQYDEIWAAAGTPMHVFRTTPDELLRATGATIADLAKAQPAKAQPGNTQPGNTQPGNTQSANTQSANTQSANTQAAKAQPADAQLPPPQPTAAQPTAARPTPSPPPVIPATPKDEGR